VPSHRASSAADIAAAVVQALAHDGHAGDICLPVARLGLGHQPS
jgi:hypothetical protein